MPWAPLQPTPHLPLSPHLPHLPPPFPPGQQPGDWQGLSEPARGGSTELQIEVQPEAVQMKAKATGTFTPAGVSFNKIRYIVPMPAGGAGAVGRWQASVPGELQCLGGST